MAGKDHGVVGAGYFSEAVAGQRSSQRQADGAGDVPVFEVRCRAHVDQDRAGLEHSLRGFKIDLRHTLDRVLASAT
jgi:hypothetical protein